MSRKHETPAQKLKRKMRETRFQQERVALLREYDKFAPKKAASLYKSIYGSDGKFAFFARETTKAEKELYGTPYVYRFNERPHTSVSVDGTITEIGLGSKS